MLYHTELEHSTIVESAAGQCRRGTALERSCHQEAHGLVLGEDQHISLCGAGQSMPSCGHREAGQPAMLGPGDREVSAWSSQTKDNILHRGRNWCQGLALGRSRERERGLSWLDCRPCMCSCGQDHGLHPAQHEAGWRDRPASCRILPPSGTEGSPCSFCPTGWMLFPNHL